MIAVLALVSGALYAAGLYMMLRRSIVKALIGLALLGHAANLLLFTSAGLTRGAPPLIPEDADRLSTPVATLFPRRWSSPRSSSPSACWRSRRRSSTAPTRRPGPMTSISSGRGGDEPCPLAP